MFRSRSKFDNEAPMSRRGTRVGLVFAVALAMVAVLASTVGVLSSQTSTPPTLTFVDVSHATTAFEGGDAYQITYSSSSSAGYALVVDQHSTTTAGFNFAQDIVKDSFKVTPNMGSETTITGLPQTVSIESGTTEIIITFELANDLLAEPNEALVLNITPGSGSSAMGTILLNDPPVVEATFSVSSPINEGDSAEIGITLSEPLTLFHLFNRRTGQSGYTREEFTGSNFEDISSMAGAAFPVDDNNERYGRSLGFDFWFYGTQHSDIAVHTNGFVGFTDDPQADVEEFANPTMGAFMGDATPGTNLPIVAPLLSPIGYINQTGAAFYGARLGAGTADDRYIVQYTNAATLINEGAGTRAASTFQVALYASGTIEFRYQNIPTTVQNVSKIGISNGTGTGMFDEFSYRATNLGATSNVRLVYTPKDSLINAVIKNSAGDTVETVDILEKVAVGAQSGSFMVSHLENTDWDGNQDYTVELDSAMPLLVTAPDPAPAAVTYTVNDNDDPEVTLDRVSGSDPIEEGNSVMLRARLDNAPSGGAPEDLLVNLDVTGSAVSGDHNVPASVTIANGATERVFTVVITDDNVAELEEMLNIQVGTLMYGSTTVLKSPTPSEVDLTIPRNDTIAVTWFAASDTNEGDLVTVRISLNRVLPAGTAADAVKLVLDGTDRTNDVTDSSWNIATDLKASTSAVVRITLTEDTLLEGNEQVTLNLEVDSALDDIFPAGDRGGDVTFNILDDEDGTIGFIAPTRTTYNEGEPVVLMVGLASGVTTVSDIIVNYQTSTSSATRVATIPADQNAVAITIASNDDDSDAEETEVFRVTLTGASSSNTDLNARVAISPTSQTPDITILDNEPLAYNFVGSGTVSEGGTPYTVRLRRVGMLPDSGSGAMVAYTVAGSGISAADFVGGSPLRGNFVFSNYAAESADVTLTGAADNSLEGDETFRITAAGETHDVKLVDGEPWDIGIVRLGATDIPEEGDLVRFRIELMLESGVRTTTDITVEYEIMASPGLVAVSAPGLRSGFAQGLALPVRGLAQAQLVNLRRTATIPAGQDGVEITIQLDESPDDTQQLTVNLVGVSTNSGDPLPVVPFTGPNIPVASPSVLTVPVLDRVVVDGSFGDLPPTGGPVLPVWLLLVLALTGIALLVPTLRRLI